jgi:phosphate/sulfate permease
VPDLESPVDSALPSRGARLLAFLAIVVAGLCGGLIGYAVTDLQCQGSCSTNNAVGALVGAAFAAGGVAVVAVLALRAMGEWQTIQERKEREGGQDSNVSRRNPSA